METWLLQSQCIIQQKLESRFAGWFVFQFFAGWEKNVRLPAVFGKFPQAKSLQIRVPPSTNLRRVLKKHANNSRKRIGSSGTNERLRDLEITPLFHGIRIFRSSDAHARTEHHNSGQRKYRPKVRIETKKEDAHWPLHKFPVTFPRKQSWNIALLYDAEEATHIKGVFHLDPCAHSSADLPPPISAAAAMVKFEEPKDHGWVLHLFLLDKKY